MSEDKRQKINEGLSSELLKKGLSSSNLQAGLNKTPSKTDNDTENSGDGDNSKNAK